MTIMDYAEVKCALCNTKSKQLVLFSSNIYGYPDLDGRPGPMLGDVVPGLTQACPNCKYCSNDISAMKKMADGLRQIISSKEYQEQFSNPDFPEKANHNLCFSLIQEKTKHELEAANISLQAAWACDDERNEAAAIKCRERAITLFRKLKNPYSLTTIALADCLRRTERFEQAEQTCNQLLKKMKQISLKNIVKYELRLIQGKDIARRNFGDEYNRGAQNGS